MKPVKNKLIISDLQIPFEMPDALAFCKAAKEHFKVEDGDVYNVGDEVDVAGINDYQIDPDGISPGNELELCKVRIKEWGKVFPKMKIADSNHPARIHKRALKAGIPSKMIKSLGEIYEAPKGWVWKPYWVVDGVVIEHGHHFGGMKPNVEKALLANMKSTIVGHFHNDFKIEYLNVRGRDYFFCVAGSLINNRAYAFNYNKKNHRQPVLGIVVLIDKEPRLVPMRLDKEGRWDGMIEGKKYHRDN